MKSSDILHMATAIRTAIKEAGTGEFNWIKHMMLLDEAGYDIVRRPVSCEPTEPSTEIDYKSGFNPPASVAPDIVEAAQQANPRASDKLFND